MAADSPVSVSRTIANGGTDRDGSKRTFGRWTFEYTPARKFVEERLRGRVLNACAGKSKLNHSDVVRNDLNPGRDADTHHDVSEIARHFDARSFDVVVFDPPFDDLQAEDKYDSLRADRVLEAFRQFDELVKPGGLVITFGWNSWGMSSLGAWDREETVLFQRGPVKRDVIATADRRSSGSLSADYGEQSDGGEN